jgi:VanZ family protein
MDGPPRFRRVFLFLAVLWEIGIYRLSSMAGSIGEPSFLKIYLANAAHAGIYAVLAFLVAMGVPATRKWIWIAFVATVFLGATDELHQAFVPNRTPQVLDWTTDLFGALFGVTFRLILLSWPRDRGVLFALLGLSVIFASASAYAASL